MAINEKKNQQVRLTVCGCKVEDDAAIGGEEVVKEEGGR